MDIDAIIAAGTSAPADNAQPAEKPADAKIGTIEEATTEGTESESTEPQRQEEKADQPWPKKAENALAREKGKAARLKFERDQERATRAQLEQKLAQLQTPQQPQPKSASNTGEPQEADFNNYADYMRAVQKYDLEQALAARDSKQQQDQTSQAEYNRLIASLDEIDKAADKFIAEVPDAQDVFDNCEDVLMAMPDAIKKVFLEAGVGAELAVYNLAKEGKLEALGTMSPAKAAMEIGRAQTQALQPKPVTKAPTPMTPVRGAASGGKSLDRMQYSELKEWLNTRSG